jgi:hypothetical protein
MSILFSGDFHANLENDELNLITKKSLIRKYGQDKYNDIKYHIILGDGCFMWPGNHKTDLLNYYAFSCRPFPVLCVIGNHEPVLGMKNIPETDIGIGETVYQIQDNPFVAYLKRGKIYTIGGFKFLALGGALSIDKKYRKPGITWWENEYWSVQEKQDVLKLLETESVFDCVISHTGPDRINKMLFHYPARFPKINKMLLYYPAHFPKQDEVARLNDQIDARLQSGNWWCGHWHRDTYHLDNTTGRGYQYLYRTTKILDKQDGKLTVYSEDIKQTPL